MRDYSRFNLAFTSMDQRDVVALFGDPHPFDAGAALDIAYAVMEGLIINGMSIEHAVGAITVDQTTRCYGETLAKFKATFSAVRARAERG